MSPQRAPGARSGPSRRPVESWRAAFGLATPIPSRRPGWHLCMNQPRAMTAGYDPPPRGQCSSDPAGSCSSAAEFCGCPTLLFAVPAAPRAAGDLCPEPGARSPEPARFPVILAAGGEIAHEGRQAPVRCRAGILTVTMMGTRSLSGWFCRATRWALRPRGRGVEFVHIDGCAGQLESPCERYRRRQRHRRPGSGQDRLVLGNHALEVGPP